MSTTPTETLETIAATLETLPTETVAAEAGFDFEAVKALMDNFDPASLLPDLSTVFGWMELACRVAVLVGPILLAVMGLAYLFFSPKEANYYFGYRTYYGMGSVEAWRFTQRFAGIVLGVLGLVLTGVMILVSGGFAGMEVMDMVWKALKCLGIEAVLALVANILITVVTALRFDRRGEYRNRKKA